MTADPLVLLVTSSDFPNLAVDDRELLLELRSRGVRAEPAVWDDHEVNWSEATLCVLRSVYDYHLRRSEFLAWVEWVSAVTVLANDAETVRWSSHKSYLEDLASAGLPVIETAWLRAGETADVANVCRSRGWSKAIVKPAVSASAHETLPFLADDAGAAQAHTARILESGDVMVQPYLDEIETMGETSVIWLGGRRTHATRRPSGIHSSIDEARRGTPITPSSEEVELATAVFETVRRRPLYARIDLVTTRRWGMLLLELELIEPALYLRHAPAPVIVFADAINRVLKGIQEGRTWCEHGVETTHCGGIPSTGGGEGLLPPNRR